MSYDSSQNEQGASLFLATGFSPRWSPDTEDMLAKGFMSSPVGRNLSTRGQRDTLSFDEGTEGRGGDGSGGSSFSFSFPPLPSTPSFGGLNISPQYLSTAYFLSPADLLAISDPSLQSGGIGGGGGTTNVFEGGGLTSVTVEVLNTDAPGQIPGEIEFFDITNFVSSVAIEASEIVARLSRFRIGLEQEINGSVLTLRLYVKLSELSSGQWQRIALTTCAANRAGPVERGDALAAIDFIGLTDTGDPVTDDDGNILTILGPDGEEFSEVFTFFNGIGTLENGEIGVLSEFEVGVTESSILDGEESVFGVLADDSVGYVVGYNLGTVE